MVLRSATGSVRGTKSQLLKEMEKVDDVITQSIFLSSLYVYCTSTHLVSSSLLFECAGSQTMRGSQPSELFIEMMNEKASLIESNPLEFREKLLGIRRKGGGIHFTFILKLITFFVCFCSILLIFVFSRPSQ